MNKIVNTYLMVFFIPVAVFGQEQTTENAKEKKLTLGITSSIEYCNYDFINEDGTGLKNFKYNNKINYSFGIYPLLHITKKVDIGIGLLFSEKGFKKVYNDDVNEGDGTMIVDYFARYLDVPVFFHQYLVAGEKYIAFVSGALTAGILVDNKNITKYSDNNKKTNPAEYINFKPMAMSTSAGIGIQYKANKHFRIGIEPYVKYHFTKIAGMLIKRPVSVGIYVTFLFQ